MRAQHSLVLSGIALCSMAYAAEPGPDVPDTDASNRATVTKTEVRANIESMDKTDKPLPPAGLKDRVRYTFPPAAKK